MKKKIIIFFLMFILLFNSTVYSIDFIVKGDKIEEQGSMQKISEKILVPQLVLDKLNIKYEVDGDKIVIGDLELKNNSYKHNKGYILTKEIKGYTVPVYAPVQIIEEKIYIPIPLLEEITKEKVVVKDKEVIIGEKKVEVVENTNNNNNTINNKTTNKTNTTNNNTTNNNTTKTEQPKEQQKPEQPKEQQKPEQPKEQQKPEEPKTLTINPTKPNFKRTGDGREIYYYWVANPAKDQVLPLLGESVIKDHENKFKEITEGWYMPYITRFSNDNFENDKLYLAQTLEGFMNNGSFMYNCNGNTTGFNFMLTGVEINTKEEPDWTYAEIYMLRSFEEYGDGHSWAHFVKYNYIVPQTIMYYFPETWYYIYENSIGRKNTMEEYKIYLIEDREVFYRGNVLIISKKGGKLNRDVINEVYGTNL